MQKLTSLTALVALLGVAGRAESRELLQSWCTGKAAGLYPSTQGACSATFYQCANGITYTQTCGTGTVFDVGCTCCNYKTAVTACTSTPTTPSPTPTQTQQPPPSPAKTSSQSCSSTASPGGACGSGVCCPSGQCCSQYNWCGVTTGHCGSGCQTAFGTCNGGQTPSNPSPQPTTPSGASKVASYVSETLYNQLFPIAPSTCTGKGFYTYSAFIQACNTFPRFASESSDDNNRRELAAFLAQISHETTGGGTSGGLCWRREGEYPGAPAIGTYCDAGNTQYPCVAGQSYRGRGPMQLSWNYNYGQAGAALGLNLLSNPDLVAQDAVLSFRTALWFWMTAQGSKPSCHAIMIGTAPTISQGANGFGLTTNVINGGIECSRGSVVPQEQDRVDYYNRYAPLLSTSVGSNLYCNNQGRF